jgi:hypothetical protein
MNLKRAYYLFARPCLICGAGLAMIVSSTLAVASSNKTRHEKDEPLKYNYFADYNGFELDVKGGTFIHNLPSFFLEKRNLAKVEKL